MRLATADPGWPAPLAHLLAIAIPITSLATPSPSPSPSPAPSASPQAKPSGSPSPTPGPKLGGGGPLQFSVTGSLNLGRSVTQSTLNLGGPLGAASTTQTTGNETVGLLAQLTRRTATTTTDFRIPIGFSNVGSTTGLALVSFANPYLRLAYGTQSSSIFGLIPPSSTLRGLALTLPVHTGDVTYFEGPSFGVGQEGLRVLGLRLRRLLGRRLVEFSLVRSSAGALTGPSTTALVGFAQSNGRGALIGEMAFQRRQAPDATLNGLTYAARFDTGTGSSGMTFTLRHVPARYLILGAGEAAYDNLLDVVLRGSHKRQSASFETAFETTGIGGMLTSQERNGFTLFGPIHRVSYALSILNQRLLAASGAQWIGSGSLQFTLPTPIGFASAGLQLSRSTQSNGGALAGAGYTFQFQRQFGPYSTSIGEQLLRQSSSTNGPTRQIATNFAVNRILGKATLGFTYNLLRTNSATSQAVQRTPILVVGRRISPVISVQASYGEQSLTDALNPASNGRSKIFSIQFNAPFAFGNGAVQGRIDPRLPAIIQGRVINDLGDNAGLLGFAPGGVANIAVVLDGTTVQRTDLSGNFQFNFVSPGPHQVRVESSSLPHGLTVDQPVIGLTLQGGQTGQVYFRVGNFGAIDGHVYGRDSSGALIPLSSVQVRVDSGAYSVTDPQGNYGFGRLSPGEHTVHIIENTVPAFATFSKAALTQKIVVQNGKISVVNFDAQPLGSIAGYVLFNKSLYPRYKGGVDNAYVVAEPGDHSAITNEDGSFIVDDLPPGEYTVSVDPETVPDQTGQVSANLHVTLAGNAHIKHLILLIGHKRKKIVFSFLGNAGSVPTVAHLRVSEDRLPPGGSTLVSIAAAENAARVTLEAFGRTLAMRYDRASRSWIATLVVPGDAKVGSAALVAHVQAKSPFSASAHLVVDPKIPLVLITTTPREPILGSYVKVRMRILAPMLPGARIAWQDGTQTKLGRPILGRIYVFTIRLTTRPYAGVLISGSARIPVEIR